MVGQIAATGSSLRGRGNPTNIHGSLIESSYQHPARWTVGKWLTWLGFGCSMNWTGAGIRALVGPMMGRVVKDVVAVRNPQKIDSVSGIGADSSRSPFQIPVCWRDAGRSRVMSRK